jgi:hypothetical protein
MPTIPSFSSRFFTRLSSSLTKYAFYDMISVIDSELDFNLNKNQPKSFKSNSKIFKRNTGMGNIESIILGWNQKRMRKSQEGSGSKTF